MVFYTKKNIVQQPKKEKENLNDFGESPSKYYSVLIDKKVVLRFYTKEDLLYCNLLGVDKYNYLVSYNDVIAIIHKHAVESISLVRGQENGN